MENISATTEANFASILEMGNYQQQLLEKHKNLNPTEITVNPDNQALMKFNGYYSLGQNPGDFFAVDANMIYLGLLGKYYTVDLLIAMSGTAPAKISFTGTFDGVTLNQSGTEGWSFNLTFTRTDGNSGTTAKFTGSITPPGGSPVTVTGATYNNLIPSTLFAGSYYVPVPPESDVIDSPLLQITENDEIFYDNGSGLGLKQIQFYVYNMNMYFFYAITTELQTVFLIMGSAAEGGLACNDINITTPGQRSLQTIQHPPVPNLIKTNPNSAALAAFSGYYQISSFAPHAFLSIEGEYTTSNGSVNLNMVKIGVSYDGVTSFGYYFEANNMTFENNVLSMPDQNITLTFTREYAPSKGSLVSVSGTMNGISITGCTLFNPVPLTAFGGVPMTNEAGDSLTIVSNTEVIYTTKPIGGDSEVYSETVTMSNIIYVPVMYILAAPVEKPTTMMSFGTNGLHGNTCIITTPTGMTVVSAHP